MRILQYLIIILGLVYRVEALSIHDIRRKFSQLESKVSTLESSNKNLLLANQNLTATMKLHEATNKKVISRITNIAASNKNLTSSYKNLISSYKKVISSNKNLSSRITSVEATNKNLTSSNKNLTSSNKSLSSSNMNLSSRITSIEASYKNLISSNKNLISSNTNLSSRITSIDSTNKNLMSSNKNLISSNKNLISSNMNLSSRITIIEATNKKLISSNTHLISSNNDLISSNRTFSREIDVLKLNISSITTWVCALGVDAQLNQKYCPQKKISLKQDCLALYQAGVKINGIYNVTLGGIKAIKVYCDQTTDGGGWTVIQRRKDGSTDFYRNWSDYKQGFGNIRNDFFIGNAILNNLSTLDNTKGSELRVDMGDFEGNRAYATYSSFKVDDESAKYRLHVSGYTGNAGDSLSYNNDQQFSTHDQDNDVYSGSCANIYRGGWWYGGCFYAHLNGEYLTYKQPQPGPRRGIIWNIWKGDYYSLKHVEMKVRRNV